MSEMKILKWIAVGTVLAIILVFSIQVSKGPQWPTKQSKQSELKDFTERKDILEVIVEKLNDLDNRDPKTPYAIEIEPEPFVTWSEEGYAVQVVISVLDNPKQYALISLLEVDKKPTVKRVALSQAFKDYLNPTEAVFMIDFGR